MKMSKERMLAINLINNWVQDHVPHDKYVMAGVTNDDAGIVTTGNNLTYVVRYENIMVDALSLVDRIELLLKNKMRNQKIDGCHCAKCNEWYEMATPNQPNGTLICYSCRTNAYA